MSSKNTQDGLNAAVSVLDNVDVIGFVNIAASATDYTITLPDGVYQLILDASSDVAICKWGGATAALTSLAAPVAGIIVGAGVAPVVRAPSNGGDLHVRMTNSTGKLYIQSVRS